MVAGQTAALALKKVKRGSVRKGMVLVDERLHPKASWEFEADIAILTHSTTIQPRYQAVIHCEIIRQVGAWAAIIEACRRQDLASSPAQRVYCECECGLVSNGLHMYCAFPLCSLQALVGCRVHSRVMACLYLHMC